MTEESAVALVPEKPLPIPREKRVETFELRFKELCDDLQIEAACFVIHHPIYGQARIFGHAIAHTVLQNLLDKTLLAAQFRAERAERKEANFAKRQPDKDQQ